MIRFYNGRLLAMNGSFDVTADEVWTDGARIAYVGPEKPAAERPAFEREINLRGNLLMPGFKSAHAHSAMTFVRSIADDMPLQPWLFERIFPLEDRLNAERVAVFTKLAVLEYLTTGITAAYDMYYYRTEGAAAAAESGFRYVLNGLIGTPEEMEEEYLRFNSGDPLVSLIPGMHAEYTMTLENMKLVSDLVHKYKTPFFTHNSETESETRECVERHGMTPTELFDSLGLYDFGGGGFHCVYLSEHDMEIFKKRNLWAVTCPASNAKLASGIAPLTTFLEKGINLAIGTDGPSSNNALDMFREMYLACVLQKLRCRDAAACDALDILSAACTGSARAIGLNDCDCIAEGKQADMIVIDMSRPNMQPELNIVKNLVYSGSKENVKLTMIAGRVLYENGEFFIGADPAEIYAKTAFEVKKLLAEG